MVPPYRVTLVEPERLSLAAHMVAGLLRRNLVDARCAARAARVRGAVVVDAGGMKLCLEFGASEVRVRGGEADHPRARIAAPLDALLGVALGRGVVGAFLRGRVKARGNPLVLWRLLGLMKAGEEAREEVREEVREGVREVREVREGRGEREERGERRGR
ncbi:MAG: SCP2 sterol-binding domain-containing protein [Deltaproteobacteria bacterium]|nr:SCP2 sterol-binding domain-containing protein [Deltaproteobacteria bacterium]